MWCISGSAYRPKAAAVFFFVLMLLGTRVFPLGSEEEGNISELFKEQADSIVLVAALDDDGKETKMGTGFIVSEDGLIVTNYHIVSNASRIIVKLKKNKAYQVIGVVGADPEKDLAVLKIMARDLDPVRLGNSRRVKVGQRVVAIGNPLGLESTVADGLVSAVRETDDLKLLQISVPLSHGSSGGPLFDLRGKVVGVTTASHAGGQNLNFAVPVNYVKKLLSRSKSNWSEREYVTRLRKKISKREFDPQAVPLAMEESHDQDIYKVKSDDTLYGLARRFHTSVDEIMRLNNLKESTIYRGQRLKVPATEL